MLPMKAVAKIKPESGKHSSPSWFTTDVEGDHKKAMVERRVGRQIVGNQYQFQWAMAGGVFDCADALGLDLTGTLISIIFPS